MKKPPVVDEVDVNRMINFILGRSYNEKLMPEERADAAYNVALGLNLLHQRSIWLQSDRHQ
jgi:hypothetical protein